MPVFISHKREDTTEADVCLKRLRMYRVPAYLDVLDNEIEGSPDITEHFLTQLRKCTHLIAAISANTQRSWWVPFEIGVASALEKRICSTSFNAVDQPEYLSKWPRLNLHSNDDYEKFATAYHREATAELRGLDAVKASIRNPAQFHAQLKRALGQ